MYSSRLLNSIKRNYITTERDVLVMFHTWHKFKNYMLGNMFTFFVDHMALVYLVNKPHVSARTRPRRGHELIEILENIVGGFCNDHDIHDLDILSGSSPLPRR